MNEHALERICPIDASVICDISMIRMMFFDNNRMNLPARPEAVDILVLINKTTFFSTFLFR